MLATWEDNGVIKQGLINENGQFVIEVIKSEF